MLLLPSILIPLISVKLQRPEPMASELLGESLGAASEFHLVKDSVKKSVIQKLEGVGDSETDILLRSYSRKGALIKVWVTRSMDSVTHFDRLQSPPSPVGFSLQSWSGSPIGDKVFTDTVYSSFAGGTVRFDTLSVAVGDFVVKIHRQETFSDEDHAKDPLEIRKAHEYLESLGLTLSAKLYPYSINAEPDGLQRSTAYVALSAWKPDCPLQATFDAKSSLVTFKSPKGEMTVRIGARVLFPESKPGRAPISAYLDKSGELHVSKAVLDAALVQLK